MEKKKERKNQIKSYFDKTTTSSFVITKIIREREREREKEE